MKKCGIYKITSPTNKVYIGQSIDIDKRWYSYKNLHCKTQPRIYNSLKKHGADNHIFEIVFYCIRKELNKMEEVFIELYNALSIDFGLNCENTTESKKYTYQLTYNENRLKKERLIRKKETQKKYLKNKRKKEEQEPKWYSPRIFIPCPMSKKSFILSYPPKKHTCIEYWRTQLPF